MSLTGDTFSVYLRTNVLPLVQRLWWDNSAWTGAANKYIEVVRGAAVPGGTDVDVILDTSRSSNAAAYTFGDPAPTPDTTTSVRAYFTKEMFTGMAKTYDFYKGLAANGGAYPGTITDMDMAAIERATADVIDVANDTFSSDVVTWIDSTGTFSDAALSKSTYTSLVSYESTSVGVLAVADLDAAIEAMEDTTYGPVDRSKLCWIMARNQFGHVAELTSNVAYNSYNYFTTRDGQSSANYDAEATRVIKTYGDIPIWVVPGFSTTDILLVNRDAVKVYEWMPLTVTPKQLMAPEEGFLIKYGAILAVLNPRECGKLSGVTA
jgi:hypothetical protein